MEQLKRENIDSKYKWDLQLLIKSDSEFTAKLKQLIGEMESITKFKGKLSQKDSALACLNLDGEISKKLETLYCYAQLNNDLNAKDAKGHKMRDSVANAAVKYSSLASFIIPELSNLSDTQLDDFINDSNFSHYDYTLKRIKKNKPHTLSQGEEKIIAETGDILDSFHQIFNMIDNADLNLGKVTDNDGKEIQLTHGAYSVIMQGKDRQLREKAFNEYYSAYKKLNRTISAVYTASVKSDWFYAKIRNYKSCMQATLSGNDVDEVVYKNLLESVSKNLSTLHKYIKLKKQLLGVDKFYMYDMSVPILSEVDFKKSYDEAYEIVKQGMAPLGEEYTKLLETAYNDKWLDVYETDGKRSGAYSMGVYGAHPFVLLNYQETIGNVFTIAHEMGHALHSYYSEKAQPYSKADYKIFVAEVASTVNEMLLIKHLQKTTKDQMLQKYLLNYYLEMARTTLFRQTQFAEFEAKIHELIENDESLSAEDLNAIYKELNNKYYGDTVEGDETIEYEWSRIPHFYRSFYVYQYATGIISAIYIADSILKEGAPAVERYKKFLSSGGSASPVELLKIAGVDLTKKEVFENAMRDIEKTLTEFLKVMS